MIRKILTQLITDHLHAPCARCGRHICHHYDAAYAGTHPQAALAEMPALGIRRRTTTAGERGDLLETVNGGRDQRAVIFPPKVAKVEACGFVARERAGVAPIAPAHIAER